MLEINKNHNRANLKGLKKPLKTIAASLSIPVVIFVYSGANIDNNVYSTDIVPKSKSVQTKSIVPDSCYWDVLECIDSTKSNITEKDLEGLETLNFSIYKDESLDFLKYCKNLQEVSIFCQESDTSVLKTMPKVEKLKKLTIITTEDSGLITEDLGDFFKNCSNVETLEVYGASIGPNTLEQMKGLKTLKIVRCKNIDSDLSKTSIEKFDFSENPVYDIPLVLDSKKYYELIKDEKEINFGSEERKQKYLEIDKRLDDIVKQLDIKDTDDDKAKLNKILVYVLETMTYDKKVAEQDEYSDVPEDEYFYKEGSLYGALETKTSICGNYTAEVTGVARKVGLETYYTVSLSHAYNLVKIEGNLYVVDATWLDGSNDIIVDIPIYNEKGEIISYHKGSENDLVIDNIKRGKTEGYDWYLADPSLENMKKLDPEQYHDHLGFPSYMEEIKESGDSEVTVAVGDKKVKTTLGAFIGSAVAFGGARLIKRQPKEKDYDKKRA